MIICIIILIGIITVLIYILNKNNHNKIKLLENYNSLNDKFQFLERELARCNIQLDLYREDKKEKNNKKNNIYERKKVIIDDYCKDTSNYSRKILESFGLIVDIVRTGHDIIDRISHNFQYDIIITNSLYKDGVKGENVLEQLREIKNFDTPIVIHTINKNKRQYYMKECKFDEYLEKPLKQADVAKVLSKFIK